LEKIYIYGEPVTLPVCKKICSYISTQKFEEYIGLLQEGRLHSAIQVLYEIHDQGYSVIDILDYLYNFVKITSLLDEETKYKVIPLLCKYITVFNKIHEDVIELAFFSNHLQRIFAGAPSLALKEGSSLYYEMLENIL
jgi:hypothetical protein